MFVKPPAKWDPDADGDPSHNFENFGHMFVINRPTQFHYVPQHQCTRGITECSGI